jgi:hypothetical protein
MSKSNHDKPRIYVADLAACNAGRLHGALLESKCKPILEAARKCARCADIGACRPTNTPGILRARPSEVESTHRRWEGRQ